jgi:hypothetical protein
LGWNDSVESIDDEHFFWTSATMAAFPYPLGADCGMSWQDSCCGEGIVIALIASELAGGADAEDQPLRLWPLRLGLGRRLLEHLAAAKASTALRSSIRAPSPVRLAILLRADQAPAATARRDQCLRDVNVATQHASLGPKHYDEAARLRLDWPLGT